MRPGSWTRGGLACVITIACGVCWTGCSGVPDVPAMVRGDWQSPILTGAYSDSPTVVHLSFDEEVKLSSVAFEPDIGVEGSIWQDAQLSLMLDRPLLPGQEYWLDAHVEDTAGNSSSLLVSVYGFNPDLAQVIINEVVCEGSGSHPDWIELRVISAGNLGGLTVYEGSPAYWDSRYVFPPVDVEPGAFVIVHFKPSGAENEVSETEDWTVSGGHDSHPNALDVWVAGGDGIPNSTGALSVTTHPDGPIMDAFLYTTKYYDASDPIRGFGLASQLELMESLVAAGAWSIAGAVVIPDDLFHPADSTATRSINRSDVPDSDTALDWHIGPTSSASPGEPNTSSVYVP